MPLEIVLGMFAIMGSIWTLGRQLRAGRLKEGSFTIEQNDSGLYRFQTDVGPFVIDRARRVFRSPLDLPSRAIPLDGLERLDFTYSERRSLAQRWFWRDRTCWYHIALVSAGRELPLFAVGQVLTRIPEDDEIALPAEWFPDLDRRTREVLAELTSAFRASGSDLLVPGGATKRTAE